MQLNPVRGRACRWAVAVAASLLLLAATSGPAAATSSPHEASLTDVTASRMPAGDAGSVSYVARYRVGEDVTNVADTASLPAVSVPADDPALQRFPTPSSGHFVAFAAPAEAVGWEPVARQVGGLYFAPRFTPDRGEPGYVDVARAGDRVDFGVAHYVFDAAYPEQADRVDAGHLRWELAQPRLMLLESASQRGEGGVAVGMRTAYLHIDGGDLDANGTTADPLVIPLPDAPFAAADVNYIAGAMSGADSVVDFGWEYDEAANAVRIEPRLTGHFPESGVRADGQRTHVVAFQVFAYARISGEGEGLALGTTMSMATPDGARGELAFGGGSEGVPLLRVPVAAGKVAELGLGVARPSGEAAAATTPTAPPSGSLEAVTGEHTTTTGRVAYEVVADERGTPAVVAPRIAATGALLADAISTPYVRTAAGVQRLMADDVVDARLFPGAWVIKFGFTSGWLPGVSTAYHGTKPLPYTVEESTFYGGGATLDLVYRLDDGSFVLTTTSLFEDQAAGTYQALAEVETDVLGEQRAGETAPQTAALVATRGSAASLGGTRGRIPLSHEAAVPGGVGARYGVSGVLQPPYVYSLEVGVQTAAGLQTVAATDGRSDRIETFVLNRQASAPAPAAVGVPPASLVSASGLDIVVEADDVTLMLRP